MNVEKKAEFQAVIFAGGAGAHLYPFSDDTPKCLMPVANIPLLRFQLDLLEKNKFSGFLFVERWCLPCVVCESFLFCVSDAIVVIQKSQGKQFAEYINGVYKGPVNVQLEFIDEPVGTAEVLRRIKDKIKVCFVLSIILII
jgi:NDP-sugar pyrophosphorylase family protein